MKKIILILLFAGFYFCGNAQNRPANVYRNGKIQIAVWVDSIQKPDTLIITKTFRVSKNYKKNGQWINSSYFKNDELLQLKKLLDEAIEKEGLGGE